MSQTYFVEAEKLAQIVASTCSVSPLIGSSILPCTCDLISFCVNKTSFCEYQTVGEFQKTGSMLTD